MLSALSHFEQHAAQAQRLSRLTIRAYRSDIKGFASWLQSQQGMGTQVEDITAADVERWAASRKHVSAATLRRNLSSLAALFRFLVKHQLVAHNPLDQVDKPRCPEGQPRPLTDDHLRRLLGIVDDRRETAIILTLSLLGLRRSELLQLNVGEVDLSARRVTVREAKGGRYRVLPVPDDLAAILGEYLAEHPRAPNQPLFLGCHGRRLSRSALARLFDKWLQAAGLGGEGLTPHSARHGAALRWLKAGLSLRHVQLLLGHRDIAVTADYLRITVDDLAEQMETKVASITAEREAGLASTTIDSVWQRVLGGLSGPQRQALLSVAQSMRADSEASRP